MKTGNHNQWVKLPNSNVYAHQWLKKLAEPLKNGKWIIYDMIPCFFRRESETVTHDVFMAYGL